MQRSDFHELLQNSFCGKEKKTLQTKGYVTSLTFNCQFHTMCLVLPSLLWPQLNNMTSCVITYVLDSGKSENILRFLYLDGFSLYNLRYDMQMILLKTNKIY